MSVTGLLSTVHNHPSYQQLLRLAEVERSELVDLALQRCARSAITAALHADMGVPTILLVARVEHARRLQQDLIEWSPVPNSIDLFPEPTPLPHTRAPWGPRSRQGRLKILRELNQYNSPVARDLELNAPLIVASARAAAQKTLPRTEYLRRLRLIRLGQRVNLEELLGGWLQAGYRPTTLVDESGTFCRRGGIIDICPAGDEQGVRIELFGNLIESIRRFDLETQRTALPVERVLVPPATEALPTMGQKAASTLEEFIPADDEELQQDFQSLVSGSWFSGIEFYLPFMYSSGFSLLDHVPEDAVILIDDMLALESEVKDLEERTRQLSPFSVLGRDEIDDNSRGSALVGWDQLESRLQGLGAINLGGVLEGRSDFLQAFSPGPRYGGQLKPFMEQLDSWSKKGEPVVVISRQATRLADIRRETESETQLVDELKELPSFESTLFVQGALSEGFSLHQPAEADESGVLEKIALLHVLSDAEVFGWSRPEPRQAVSKRTFAPEVFFSDIDVGDMVVHIDHGLGRFSGLVNRTIAGRGQEYLLVDFANDDQLYVPVHQADRLSRYVGVRGGEPIMSRLGGIGWEQVKEKALKAVEDMADDLLELYVTRASVKGFAFSTDQPWQAELEASFPYVETEDQIGAIREIKVDMERARPMDRLICGDVGYGKTEVALRAAFKAAMDGKQVGLLVPTTVLAQQHFEAFSRRLGTFPVEIRMLSRFRSRKEQEKIIRDLRKGKVDIVIGTHRLLQKDVEFKSLGLLIVDEEQRFGVAHKEVLKQLRSEVDVLTMTATPIPRTLYFSLSGIRDISLITTPPEERLPVQTKVGQYDEDVARRAILRELDRGGQVFFVHNRVQTIEAMANHVRRLVPSARVDVGHGQMHERDLERVMLEFVAGEIDVLVSTSIIESGLDIPNANTIIVDRAENFGLSQLYQLRGRVGRGARRAFGFFFYRNPNRLTSEARARLETLAEHTELGSGYAIAMRDLEIRGAGEILGTRQHGHISAVGYDLYMRLLAKAVRERQAALALDRDEEAEPKTEVPNLVTIDLPLRAYIPEDYVDDDDLRFNLYRRLASMMSLNQIDDVASELADRFGAIPDEVDNLLYQLRVKTLASRSEVQSISAPPDQIAIKMDTLENADRYSLQRFLGPDSRVSKHAVWLRRDKAESDWKVILVQVLEKLAEWHRRNMH
ncbi:MAG: transcription-repair coupling factor [Chloroflexota bacterium]